MRAWKALSRWRHEEFKLRRFKRQPTWESRFSDRSSTNRAVLAFLQAPATCSSWTDRETLFRLRPSLIEIVNSAASSSNLVILSCSVVSEWSMGKPCAVPPTNGSVASSERLERRDTMLRRQFRRYEVTDGMATTSTLERKHVSGRVRALAA